MARTKTTTRPAKEGKAPRPSKALKKASVSKAAAEGEKKERKPHRWRSGTVALREIKQYQKSTDNLIQRLPFQRLVREITQKYQEELRFQASALSAIQESCEAYLTQLLSDSNTVAIQAGRVTVKPSDLKTVRALRNESW